MTPNVSVRRGRSTPARFPSVGAPGKLSNDVSGSLDRAADLLGSLGHTVAEQKLDMRPQDTAVILGLMFRFVRELDDDHRVGRLAVAALMRPRECALPARSFA